jgi:hypothetical protein
VALLLDTEPLTHLRVEERPDARLEQDVADPQSTACFAYGDAALRAACTLDRDFLQLNLAPLVNA